MLLRALLITLVVGGSLIATSPSLHAAPSAVVPHHPKPPKPPKSPKKPKKPSAPTPEPTTLGLLALGGLAVARARRQRQTRVE